MATENDTTPSNWNTETLKQYFSTLVNDLKAVASAFAGEVEKRHDQRFSASERALELYNTENRRMLDERDARYMQRFEANEKAMVASDASAGRAVKAALEASERAVQSQLASSDKAIAKAETAQQNWNQIQNEWRSTINDITKNVADRARLESGEMVHALSLRMDVSVKSLTDKIDTANTRLDKTEGRQTGGMQSTSTLLAVVAVVAAVVSLGVNLVSQIRNDPPPAPVASTSAAPTAVQTQIIEQLRQMQADLDRYQNRRLQPVP